MPAQMPSVADLRALPPGEFMDECNYPDSILSDALEEAAAQVDEVTWGEPLYPRAVKLLAAHVAILMHDGGRPDSTKTISSVQIGPASVTFGNAASVADDPRLSTTYGQRFVALEKMVTGA